MKVNKVLISCFLFVATGLFGICHAQEEEFCCERSIMFSNIEMPPGQEFNSTFMIEAIFLDGLDWSHHRFDCPIKLGWEDPGGRKLYQGMVDAILESAGSPSTLQDIESYKNFEDMDYVVFSDLELKKIDTVHQGHWEEGYEGKPDYNPARAYGDYSIRMRLLNVQFGEVVWEGYNNWNGSAEGFTEIPPDKTTPNAITELARRIQPSIDKLIYDYERIPMNCSLEMDREAAPSGEEITIRLTGINDDKGRQSRYWQRLVISLEQGEITNATRVGTEGKLWAVRVGENGVVELRFKAPGICREKPENIRIYNSCNWGGPGRPMQATQPNKQISSKSFNIVPSYPVQCRVKPEKEKLGEGEEIEILISDFRDSMQEASGRYNTIIVHASEGEILNGSKCRGGEDSRAFSLVELPVKVIYKAPEDVGDTTDEITVYNTCDNNQERNAGLAAAEPLDRIASKELQIKHYNWTGKLNMQYVKEWECNYENKGFRNPESERQEEELIMNLSLDNIQFAGMPVAVIGDINASGSLKINLETRSEEERKDFYQLNSVSSEAFCKATGANIASIQIQKKVTGDEEASRKRLEELAVSDPMKMLEELNGLTGTDDEGEFDIDVIITTAGECATNTSYHTILRSADANRDDSRTEESTLSSFHTFKLSGKMTLNKDGTGTVNASYSGEEEYRGSNPSPDCPPGSIFSRCTLTLVKDKNE